MSKAVKGVARAVKKVVKGIGKAVKKVMKSPIGRVLAIAALSFIGAPMLAGAMQGAAAGSGFLGTISGALSGAAQGFSAAMSGIGTAFSTGLSQGIGAGFDSLMSGAANNFGMGTVGQNFSNLVGSIGDPTALAAEVPGSTMVPADPSGAIVNPIDGGFLEANPLSGSSATGLNLSTAGDEVILPFGTDTSADAFASSSWGNPLSSPYGQQISDPAYAQALEGYAYDPNLPLHSVPTESSSLIDKMMKGVRDYRLGPSLVMTGGQMLYGAMQGKAQQEQIDAQERQRAADLQRMYDNFRFSWRVGPDGRFYLA